MIKQTNQQTTHIHRDTRHLPLLWLMLFCLLPASATAVPTLWKWSHPFPHGNQHNSVTTGKDSNGNDQFIAVGVGGNIVTSRYGAFSPPWKLDESITTLTLNDIAWSESGNRYVSVGDQGVIVTKSTIASANDYEKWVFRNSGTNHKLTNVIWVQKTSLEDSFFLAIGESTVPINHPIDGPITRPAATILTSKIQNIAQTDEFGVSWTLESATLNPDRFTDIPPPRLNGVTWDGTRFVASSDDGAILTSDDGIAWHTRSINSIAWNGTDLFLAVGDNGLALTSSDGATWTYQETGVTDNLYSVIWRDTSFIVVGENGSALNTYGGSTWISETTNTDNTLRAITNIVTNVVAVGDNGTILKRISATNWVVKDSGTTSDLLGVAASISAAVPYFSAVGRNGTIRISSDGDTWAEPSTLPLNFTTDLLSISWGNNTFVATGKGDALLTAADDGDSWSKQDSSLSGISDEWLFSSIWDAVSSRYIIVGSNGTVITTTDITSTNAGDWASQTFSTGEALLSLATNGTSILIGGEYAIQITTPPPAAILPTDQLAGSGRVTQEHLNDILYANTAYTAIGNAGTILTSDDLIFWTPQTTPDSNDLFDIAVDSETDQFLVSGAWGTLLRGDTTGATWTLESVLDSPSLTATTNFLYGVASNPSTSASTLVTVGSGGSIYTQENLASDWSETAGPTQTDEDINSLVTSGALMVAVGNSGVILNSTDGGANWVSKTSTSCTTSHLHDVAWRSTATTTTTIRFVAVGDAGAMCVSDDGNTWNSITPTTPPSTSSPLYSVVWGKDRFIAVGGTASSSTIYTSLDGDVWTLRNSVEPYALRDIAWNGEHFFAVGDGGTILTSLLGVTWIRNSSGTTAADLHAVAFNDEMIVVTGTEPSPLATVVLRNLDGTWAGADGAKLDDRRINNLTFGGTQFAGVTPSGSVIVSSDAQEWQEVTTGTNSLFNAITWDGSKFIVAGAGGHILHSTNPDLVITGGFLAEKVRDGEVARYRFTITNTGITTATNVSYSEELPSVSVFLSATSTRGSCTLATTLVCLLGDMATGETATITVDVTVTAVGTLQHTAEVTSDIVDNDEPNNTATIEIEVRRGNSDSGGASFSYWSLAGVLLFLLITNLLSARDRGKPF